MSDIGLDSLSPPPPPSPDSPPPVPLPPVPLPPSPSPPPVPSLKIASCLAVRKTLVLDLDETLVHSTEDWALNYDFTVSLHLRASDGSSLYCLFL